MFTKWTHPPMLPSLRCIYSSTLESSQPGPSQKVSTSSQHLPSITRGQAHDFEFYIHEIIQNIPLCVWLFFFSTNIMSQHYEIHPHFGCIIFHCVRVTHFIIHLPLVKIWVVPSLALLQFRAAMNILEHICGVHGYTHFLQCYPQK